jgi:hypothetical protein
MVSMASSTANHAAVPSITGSLHGVRVRPIRRAKTQIHFHGAGSSCPWSGGASGEDQVIAFARSIAAQMGAACENVINTEPR